MSRSTGDKASAHGRRFVPIDNRLTLPSCAKLKLIPVPLAKRRSHRMPPFGGYP